MSDLEFLDTNVLVYALWPHIPIQATHCRGVDSPGNRGYIVISTQVLAEFVSILLHKMNPATRAEDVNAALDALAPILIVIPDPGIVRRAIHARSKYGIHFYDGMIVAAAERAGCSRIWSEDLNAGQKYFGVVVGSPFEWVG